MDDNSFNNRQGQGKHNCNGSDIRRNPNDHQMSQVLDTVNQNVGNLLLPNSQGSTANQMLSYQSSSFGGLYSSPGFNSSLTGYENNIQWLTDSRMQTQHNQLSGNFISDKSINSNSHSLPPTTSHSCCVNRFGVLDSLSVGSPLPTEQIKPTCDVSSFQNKPNLSLNMIDPIQSWLNFQIPNNQQYCKYGDRSLNQNFNAPVSISSQINLPVIEQSDLKQSELCIQNPDSCFENVPSSIKPNNSGSKQVTSSIGHTISQENNSIFKQQGSYQSSIIPKDWKSTFQSMQNYISSPNMYNAVNDSQENFIFSQYNVPNSFYPASENYPPYVSANKNSSACMTQTKHQNRNENIALDNLYSNQNTLKATITDTKTQINANSHYNSKHVREQSTRPIINQGINTRSGNFNTSRMSDCCQVKKLQLNTISLVGKNVFELAKSGQDSKNIIQSSVSLDLDNQNKNNNFKNPEAVSSESEESNIIVEESDDIGEIESEISIEEIKKSYKSTEACAEEVLLRCLVCNVATSTQTPANHFIHMNDTFPVTSTRTPVRTKLEQILPLDMQLYLKVHNSFMCRRCLNLIETVELLEVKLSSAKQTISDQFSKTVQLLMPEIDHLIQEERTVSESISSEEQTVRNEPFVELEKSVDEDSTDLPVAHTNSESDSAIEFQCCYCSKVLYSQKTYNLHLQQHTKEFNYYCERCGKGFPLKSGLERHLNWHNGIVTVVQVLCEVCGDIFSSKHAFYTHNIKYHSGSYSFHCKTCGKGFISKVSLEIHSHKHSGIRSFICEYCGRTFVSKSNLNGHIKICTKDFSHKCEICGKSFTTEGQLERHELEHNGIYKVRCSVCDKGFNKPSHLKEHMVSHSQEKLHKCTECDKAYKTAFNLNYHSKIVHKQENVFSCSVCGKNFGQQSLLADHMNSHTKEKPYKCEQCGKCFVHQNTYITHLKTHTGKVKTKTCTVCGKCIKTRMSVHMRTHTGEKPYKCTYCPMAFSVSISLKKHVDIKHCSRAA